MKILVAVIAYNESKSIRNVIKNLRDYNNGYDIIVIDNSSTDDTVSICRQEGIKVITHSVNTGGPAGTVMTYFLYACENNYDILCQFDGDGQHIASELPKIINPVAENDADYVIGSRFLEKEGFQSYFFRRLGIRFFALLDSMIIKNEVTDVTSGFRAYGRKVIEFFARYYKHEISDTNQLLLLSHFAGARVKEVAVKMKQREHGQSEYNLFSTVIFPLKGLVNIMGCLLQKKQITYFIRSRYGNQD